MLVSLLFCSFVRNHAIRRVHLCTSMFIQGHVPAKHTHTLSHRESQTQSRLWVFVRARVRAATQRLEKLDMWKIAIIPSKGARHDTNSVGRMYSRRSGTSHRGDTFSLSLSLSLSRCCVVTCVCKNARSRQNVHDTLASEEDAEGGIYPTLPMTRPQMQHNHQQTNKQTHIQRVVVVVVFTKRSCLRGVFCADSSVVVRQAGRTRTVGGIATKPSPPRNKSIVMLITLDVILFWGTDT